MKTTKIEWSDSTVNPTENCDGCELWNKDTHSCYAGMQTERYKGKGAFDQRPVLHPGRMRDYANLPDLRGKARPEKPWIPPHYPRLIFVSDMADALSRDVPFTYLREEIINQVSSPNGQRHVWMWLTKQAKRLTEFSKFLTAAGVKWPANLWPGVSVTSNKTTWRISHLINVPAEHRFISYEPAWEYIDFTPWITPLKLDDKPKRSNISLIITGGESGNHRHPYNADGGRKLVQVCADAGVACFVKQMGSYCITDTDDFKCHMTDIGRRPGQWLAHLKSKKGGDWSEWPESLRVRQFPKLGTPNSSSARLL